MSEYITVQKTEADILAEQSQREAAELLEERASLFTLHEILWLQHFISKMRWGTSTERERRYLEDVKSIRKKFEERKKNHGDDTE